MLKVICHLCVNQSRLPILQNILQMFLKLVAQVFGDCRLNKVLKNTQRYFHRIRAQLQSTIIFDFKILKTAQAIVSSSYNQSLTIIYRHSSRLSRTPSGASAASRVRQPRADTYVHNQTSEYK